MASAHSTYSAGSLKRHCICKGRFSSILFANKSGSKKISAFPRVFHNDSQYSYMKMSDFSIDYILNRAGERYIGTNASISIAERIKLEQQHRRQQEAFENYNSIAAMEMASIAAAGLVDARIATLNNGSVEQMPMFDWLHYTRYHPPRLPRNLRQPPAKRTPGRLPRIPFTPAQLEALENAYRTSNYLSAEEANQLAESLELTNTRVKIWFQNRRARERREKREREESYDSTISSNASSPELHMDELVQRAVGCFK